MADEKHIVVGKHIINMVNYLLQQIGQSGAIRVFDSDENLYDDSVSSFHVEELLLNLDGDRYQNYITGFLEFFVKKPPYRHQPFMLNALIIAGHEKSKIVIEAMSELLKKRLPNGLFPMYTAYFEGGDHFSTLWAVKLLSLVDNKKYSTEIKKALRQCAEDYEVLALSPSHIGFLLHDIVLSKATGFKKTEKRILDDLISTQQNGLWGNRAITTAYVIEDLMHYEDYPEVGDAIDNGIHVLFGLDNDEANELPEVLFNDSQNIAESLFLQTLARTCLVGAMWLRKRHSLDIGLESIRNIVGQYSYLFTMNQSLKKVAEQVKTMEDTFSHLNPDIAKFCEKSPFDKNVFLMMRFSDEVRFREVEKSLKDQFQKYGLNVYMAKDRQIVDNLWDNISIYMKACKYGVAVFEKALTEEFNPNVSLELGFMLSRGKRVLLLKEKSLTALPTDVVGKLYQQFDIGNPDSVRPIVDKWVKDVVLPES